MAVAIVVGVRARDSTRGGSWTAIAGAARAGAVVIAIASYVRLIVRESDSDREAATVEGRADVPAIRRIAEQPWVVGAAVKTADARGGIAIIRRETKSAKD